MPQSDVHHIERLSPKVFGKLQIFVEAESVACAVAPVHILVSRALLNRSDGAFPAEGIVRRVLSLDEASAGEAHKFRVHIVEHLCEVGATAVLAVLERRREEAHHVKGNSAFAVGNNSKLSLRVVGVSLQRGGIFRPSLVELTFHHFSVRIYRLSRRVGKARPQRAVVVALGKKREPIFPALHGIDTPEAFVYDIGEGRGFGVYRCEHRPALDFIQKTFSR